MGVDSGLPDFRGVEGFWKAYPPFRKLGISFSQAANPEWFHREPRRAWGFYGHRYNLYNQTVPHDGFGILLSWCQSMQKDFFVFTSNVDGHFQKAGFPEDRIVECHGSLNHWQCNAACTEWIGTMSDYSLSIDEKTFLADPPLPTCSRCGELVRPNVLMFGDYQWDGGRTRQQYERFQKWIAQQVSRQMAVIEIGAGKAVPTVRIESESHKGRLVRINPRDPDVPTGGISIALGALEGLSRIDSWLTQKTAS